MNRLNNTSLRDTLTELASSHPQIYKLIWSHYYETRYTAFELPHRPYNNSTRFLDIDFRPGIVLTDSDFNFMHLMQQMGDAPQPEELDLNLTQKAIAQQQSNWLIIRMTDIAERMKEINKDLGKRIEACRNKHNLH